MLYCKAIFGRNLSVKQGGSLSVFCFVDEVLEVKKNESLTASFTLRGDEEFLQDHFDGFPVMPGVLLLESLKQAASKLLEFSEVFKTAFFRLAAAEEVKFGQFVKPGNNLKIFVKLLKREETFVFLEGRIDLVSETASPKKALTANFVLTPVEI